MWYHSTGDATHRVRVSEAMMAGLGPDGRLFVPERFPALTLADFDGADTIPEIGARLLAPFFEGDALAEALPALCAEALDFPIPLVQLSDDTAALELFHGPTAAFKDVGARFLASCMSRLQRAKDRPLTILVATSGDTGGAVAAAFHGKPGVEVIVLYPRGAVSARQERQLTCWTGNVRTFAVEGDFDDCQRMVKAAFAHPWWQANRRLSSANSINIGRLLPQMIYYAAASLWSYRDSGEAPGFVIPSGNVGNASACAWTRACGLPIGRIVLAHNANRPIPDYLVSGDWQPRATQPTLASAMDVGTPSNMERLMHLWPDVATMRAQVEAVSIDDAAIRAQIRRGPRVWGQVWCPHTACAVEAREALDRSRWIVVATAHPAKFDVIVEPLIHQAVPIPEPLAKLLDAPNYAVTIQAGIEALTRAVRDTPG